MPRNVPAALAAHMASAGHTVCYLLKITPRNAATFGITTGNRDETYDDGGGAITYRAARGYTASDITTKADLSVNNAEADGLLAQYPLDGVTMEGIARGDYDGARFVQYVINYEDHSMGHAMLSFGTVGQIKRVDDLACQIELRSLQQTLKQNSLIDLTSITCRAGYGDEACKKVFIWYRGVVTAVGDEEDRTFTFAPLELDSSGDSSGGFYTTFEEAHIDSAGEYSFPDDAFGNFFSPAAVHWTSGDYAENELEVEEFDSATNTITLVLPTPNPIEVGDEFKIRQDCDKSRAMCKTRHDNIPNMRAEPDLPRAEGGNLMAPTPSPSASGPDISITPV